MFLHGSFGSDCDHEGNWVANTMTSITQVVKTSVYTLLDRVQTETSGDVCYQNNGHTKAAGYMLKITQNDLGVYEYSCDHESGKNQHETYNINENSHSERFSVFSARHLPEHSKNEYHATALTGTT